VLQRSLGMLRQFARRALSIDARDGLDFFLRQWTIPGDARTSANVLATLSPVRAVAPRLVAELSAQRIAVIAPHPDDELMGPGGTLLRAVASGKDVTVVFLTDGESDPGKAAARRTEAIAIAGKLGYRALFLGLPLGSGMVTPAHGAKLSNALAQVAPSALLCPFVLDDNDDHQNANALLLSVEERGGLKGVETLWAYQVYSMVPGNLLVPLGEFAAAKAQAIRLYESQSAIRDWATFSLGLNAVNARFTPRSCRDTHVEAFLALPVDRYLDVVRAFNGDVRVGR
jgi:N-acetylglucosamine malate deacetylase 1